jgi:hypothetical protein
MRFLWSSLVLVTSLSACTSLALSSSSSSSSSCLVPKGSAASPLAKKKIAVLGAGGYLGALTFGFLQRALSLFGTGIGGVRAIGSTADTSIRLNRVLSKNFILAVADESYVKLTDLMDVLEIQRRLEGWDALILGNDVSYQCRPITPGTYERTPNDKTYEIYWDAPKGSWVPSSDTRGVDAVQENLVCNVIEAARRAGVQHIVAVESPDTELRLRPRLESLAPRIPYTIIRHGGLLKDTQDFTYRKGVQGQLVVSLQAGNEDCPGGVEEKLSSLRREDVAALCVQSLQSLEWSQSRCLDVKCSEILTNVAPSGKRPDQEWLVNSYLLEQALQAVL